MRNSIDEESELSKLLIVMGYVAVKDFDAIPEKVKILNNLGFSNKQMAMICGTTEGTIRVQKVVNKKNFKRKKIK